MELGINEINISKEDIIGKSRVKLTSGIYKGKIKQAYLKNSNKSASKAITLTIELEKDMIKNTSFNLTHNFDIWFINKNNEQINHSVGKIGSLLMFLGKERKISNDLFTEGQYITRVFNSETREFEEITVTGAIVKDFIGKYVVVLVEVIYELYEAKVRKKADIVCFLNDGLKTSGEVLNNEAASEYSRRLEFSKSKEQHTYDELKHLMTDTEENTNKPISLEEALGKKTNINNSVDSNSINNDIGEEDIPF